MEKNKMFSLVWLFIEVSVVVVLVALVTNSKLRRRVFSYWTRQTDSAADNFGDIVTDQQDAVKEARADVGTLRRDLAKMQSDLQGAELDHDNSVKDAEKWDSIAKQAAAKQDEAGCRSALKLKKAAEQKAIALAASVVTNTKTFEKLHAQLNAREDEISTADTDSSVQQARLTGLRMREKMLKAGKAFGGSAHLDLTAAQKQLDAYERELDNLDNLSGNDAERLEQIYKVDTPVDDEVAKMMADAKAVPLSH